MTPEIKAEYDRILAGPHSGYFTLLHHEGPVVEHSWNVRERVEHILKAKPKTEHLTRLQHIYPIPAAVWDLYKESTAVVYSERTAAARDIYNESMAAAGKLYSESTSAAAGKLYRESTAAARKLYSERTAAAWELYRESVATADKLVLGIIPNCRWDGETIFPKQEGE